MAGADPDPVLVQFHRDGIREDMRQMELRPRDHGEDVAGDLRNERSSHLDGVDPRFDRLE